MDRGLFVLQAGKGLSAEVVILNGLRLNTQRVEHGHNGLRHWARTTHVVFNILWCLMVFEVCIEHDLMNEACCVFYTSSVGSRIRTVERKMEVEVGELLLQSEEVVKIEHLVERAGTIEIVHLTVGGVQSLRHVHNLSAQRSHTGTTTYPYHLTLGVEVGMEVTIRTAHDNLVARLEGEDV